MSRIKLDLAQFKHVKNDKDTTTLRHKQGHLLKIVHTALSPEAQTQLKALAPAEDPKEMAKGGAARIIRETPGDINVGGTPFADGGKVPIPDDVSGTSTDVQRKLTATKEGAQNTEQEGKGLGQILEEAAKNWWDPEKKANGGRVNYDEGGTATTSDNSSNSNSNSNYKAVSDSYKSDKYGGVDSTSPLKTGDWSSIWAKGGEVTSSVQGKDVRKKDMESAKEEAKGRAAEERFIKPKVKGMTEGGEVPKENKEEKPENTLDYKKLKREYIDKNQTRSVKGVKRYAEGGETTAYEQGFPCLNPYCKSHGKPHPNCRCYGRMAEGGNVEDKHFCEDHKPHMQGCQYFAEGSKDIESIPDYLKPNDDDNTDDSVQIPSAQQVETPPTNQPQAPSTKPPTDENDADTDKEVNDRENDAQRLATQMSPQSEQNELANPEAGQTNPAIKNTDDSYNPYAPKSYQDTVNELMQKDQEHANDFDSGHITPKTIKDLAGPSTLGKIGTLFGLLISGAGSGLSHQPNALLGLMQKQIDNDLQAQQQSKGNAQNLVRMYQQHELNQADIQNKLRTGKISEQQAAVLHKEALQKGFIGANMVYNRAAAQEQAEKVASMPEGSEKEKAKQGLALMFNAVNNDNYNIATRYAMAKAMNDFGPQGADQEQQFAQHNQALRNSGRGDIADANEQHHIPGVPGQSTRPIPEDIRNRVQAMQVLDNKGRDVLNFISQHAGTLDPKTRAIALQKIEEMKNFYNDSIKGGALTQGRLKWYDEQFSKNPTSILAQFMGSKAKLKEMVDSNANRRNMELKGLGFPVNVQTPGQNQEPQGQSQGQPQQSKSGRPMEYRNGKWHYK